jgi:hypothetical protein
MRQPIKDRVHGARCTHGRKSMPYRDPAQRAAWMRQYRKRKRVGKAGARASIPSVPSVVRAPDDLRVSRQTQEGADRQVAPTNSRFVRKAGRSSFKTALDLARTFPSGPLASQVCPYCYNTGYSSPGTLCSYCQFRDK